MSDQAENRGILAVVLWKVMPVSFAALLAIWLVVALGGDRLFLQRELDKLEAAANQQTWVVENKILSLMQNLEDIARNALTVNSFIDPLVVTDFIQPFFRSIRLGNFGSALIVMTDFSGQIMATNRPPRVVPDLPPEQIWLEPAMAGKRVITIHDGTFLAAIPIWISSLPEGVLVLRLDASDTKELLSSLRYGGQVLLHHADGRLLFDSGPIDTALPDAEMVHSATIKVSGFPELRLRSAVPIAQDDRLEMLHLLLLLAFMIDLTAVALGIYMAASLVTRPLNRLIAKIQSLQGLADGNALLQVEGPQELADLAVAFNHAAKRQGELTRCLETALTAEKELNKLQRQFVSLVSHEFRTPLAIIDGNVRRMMRRLDQLPSERITGGLAKCRQAVSRLISLMESILSSSRLEAGSIKLIKAPCRIVDLLREVCENQEEISPGHRIIADFDRLPEQIMADEKLIHQVFTNLLSNAVKYSPNADKVWVSGTTEAGFAVVRVRDEGLGIPAAEQKNLFTRFFRATTSGGIAGTGIGLHLVKNLVEMHNGSVEVESVEGHGSTFIVRLPINADQARPEDSRHAA